MCAPRKMASPSRKAFRVGSSNATSPASEKAMPRSISRAKPDWGRPTTTHSSAVVTGLATANRTRRPVSDATTPVAAQTAKIATTMLSELIGPGPDQKKKKKEKKKKNQNI